MARRKTSVKKYQDYKSVFAEYEQAPSTKPRAVFLLLAFVIEKQIKKHLVHKRAPATTTTEA